MQDENKKLKRVVLDMSSGIVHLGRFVTYRPQGWVCLLRGMLTYLEDIFNLGAVSEMINDITYNTPLEEELVRLGKGEPVDYMDPAEYLGHDGDVEERIISHLISV